MAPKNVIIAFLALCSFAYGQTRSLLVNTSGIVQYTNNTVQWQTPLSFGVEIVAATRTNLGIGSFNSEDGFSVISDESNNVVISTENGIPLFAGPLAFTSTNIAATTRANLGFSTNLNTLWTATNASNARSAVGLGATWLTNTNVTNFRTAIGLGATNQVTFGGVFVGSGLSITNDQITGQGITIDFSGGTFSGDALGNVRSSIGLGLPALTNTSNVTMMRALSGSTNTNHPYSGSISVTGTNNTNTLVFSNGILQSVQ